MRPDEDDLLRRSWANGRPRERYEENERRYARFHVLNPFDVPTIRNGRFTVCATVAG